MLTLFISLHGTIALVSLFDGFDSFNRIGEGNPRPKVAKIEQTEPNKITEKNEKRISDTLPYDKIEALNGGNRIDASTGDDTVDAGAGKDTLYDGHDEDSVALGAKKEGHNIKLGDPDHDHKGNDTINGRSGSHIIRDFLEIWQFDGH